MILKQKTALKIILKILLINDICPSDIGGCSVPQKCGEVNISRLGKHRFMLGNWIFLSLELNGLIPGV